MRSWIVGMIIGWLWLAGCIPTAAERVATATADSPEPAAASATRSAVTTTPLPSLTATPKGVTPTAPPTATATTTLTAVSSIPTRTPIAAPAPPTATATPPVYSDIWVSGYIMGPEYGGVFQMGNSSVQQVFGDLTLEAASEAIAAELAAVPPGDTLLILTGDLHPAQESPFRFVVKDIELVNYPYSPQTPLDATYTHDDPVFQVNYPASWTIEKTGESGAVRITSMPRGAVNLRPGREHLDPTEVYVSLRTADTPSVAAYLEPLEAMGDEPPAPDIGQIQIGEWAITRVERQGLGVWVDYVIDVNGRVVVFTSNGYNEPFMRRVVETLSVP